MIDYTAAGFTLLQGAHLYAPEDRGICDVLVANGKIIAVASNIPSDIVPNCTVVDLSGQILCPGFIDQHVHLIGGGGEAGPTTRTPEVALSRLTEAASRQWLVCWAPTLSLATRNPCSPRPVRSMKKASAPGC